MKRLLLPAIIVPAISFFAACSNQEAEQQDLQWLKHGIEVSESHLAASSVLYHEGETIPYTVQHYYSHDDWRKQMYSDYPDYDASSEEPYADSFKPTKPTAWVCAFYPGSLWEMYRITGNETFKEEAVIYTNKLEPVRRVNRTHDIGFMSMPSYGNAMLLSPADSIPAFLKDCADNLCTRFTPQIGCIRSWGKMGQRHNDKWNYPVIIDNMMNLELLFKVSEMTGDSKYKDIAVSHALKTIKNHYRPDNTTFHVVSYNDDGTVEIRDNHQGRGPQSKWARGQAWGLYGFTMCYRMTGDRRFLRQAKKVAKAVMDGVRTQDCIPLWDWDAPELPETPRDASAAAITASALVELSTLVKCGSQDYLSYAEKILRSLSSPAYLAEPGENYDFILRHSCSSVIGRDNIDVPLNYADYYYLEAIDRYMQVKNIRWDDLSRP